MDEKIHGNLVYGFGIFLTLLLTVVGLFAAYWNFVPFLAVRTAEGFTEVFLYLVLKLTFS